MSETHTLELPDVDLVYDVHGPVPTADGRPLLFMIGQPMQADGFADLAAQFPDRTVVTYDPRGLGRSSVRRDGRNDQRPEEQAADLHALAEHLGSGQGRRVRLERRRRRRADLGVAVPRRRGHPAGARAALDLGAARTTPRPPTARSAASARPTRTGASAPAWRRSSR